MMGIGRWHYNNVSRTQVFRKLLLLPWAVIEFFLIALITKIFGNFLMEHLIFFGMLFSNIHKWSATKVKYERGTWLQVYGVPIQAWNDAFFRLCVIEISRFIRADECTVDKGRLDFARILVSTPHIEIVNISSEIIIDGSNFVIKLVEE